MITTYQQTCQINHSEYMKKVKTMSEDQLRYTIKDCKEALTALPDSQKAGYYADEIHYCSQELRRREEVIMNVSIKREIKKAIKNPDSTPESVLNMISIQYPSYSSMYFQYIINLFEEAK
jgi:hypothetical protein